MAPDKIASNIPPTLIKLDLELPREAPTKCMYVVGRKEVVLPAVSILK